MYACRWWRTTTEISLTRVISVLSQVINSEAEDKIEDVRRDFMNQKKNENKPRVLLGFLGVLGHLAGVLADNFTAYSVQGVETFAGSPYDLTSLLENFAPLFLHKPHWHLVLGHYLAIFGIPVGAFGLWFVYQAFKPAAKGLSLSFLCLGFLTYFGGVVYHSTFGFVGTLLREKESASVEIQEMVSNMITQFKDFTVPLAMILITGILFTSILIVYAIAFRHTIFPRWMWVVNPFLLQLLFTLLTFVVPLELQVFLTISAYNLSLLIFYLVSTLVVWKINYECT